MTYLLLSLTLILNLLCLLFKKKKIIVIIFSIIFLSLIFGGNNFNPDYDAYLLNYQLLETGSSYFEFAPLFDILMKMGIIIGLEYNEFLTIICLILYSILFVFLYKKNNYKVHEIIVFYVFFSFFIDVIQVSNFISNIFAIISVYMMYDYKNSHNRKQLFISCFFLIVAVGFHFSSAILIPLYFFIKLKKYKNLLLAVILFTFIDTFLGHIITNSILKVIPFIGNTNELSFYISYINSGYGFILYLMVILLLIALVKYYGHEEKNSDSLNFLEYVIMLSPVMSLSNITYMRFIRVIMINYSVFYTQLKARKYKKDLLISVIILIIYILLFFNQIGINYFYDIMNNNCFFS